MLHQHFKTPQGGGAIRSYFLAKALIKKGHRVVVITSFSGEGYKVEMMEGIEVHYLPIPYDNRFTFYARSRSFIQFTTAASRLATKFKDFDYCYAISVPLTVGLIARWIKLRFGIPYFFEVGDLWPDAPIQLGFIRNSFLKSSLYSLEKSIYRNAKAVIALSPAIQSSIEKKVTDVNVHIIPNMADCEFFIPEKKNPDLENQFGVAGKFVVSYIGALGVANGLDYLLECANASRKSNSKIHFIICGDGAMLEDLKLNAQRLNLNNLSFIGFANRDRVKEIMNVTDAIFVCYKNVPILETGSPNKFFDGLAAGKLIIINFGGWIRKEIEENRCGVFVDPAHPTDFTKKISPFVSDPKLQEQYQSASRELGERKYSRKRLSVIFTDLFS
ncbi:MAG: glycosyltransferase family 4 protein [Cyclobacteriaceae bacterium]|nr:glycosyltransferase family 4 protein [Cyclobacteriaceae bacterium]